MDERDAIRSVAFDPYAPLQRIGGDTFQRCRNLTSVCIPASVEWIDLFAFEAYPALREVIFPADSRLRSIK
jgi:hypothetical protein